MSRAKPAECSLNYGIARKGAKKNDKKMTIQRMIRKISCCGRMLCCMLWAALLASCARMGSPDGGWYDETPPYVVHATPEEGSMGVRTRQVDIYFNEYIKMDNATEKVIVSPPQLEQPEIAVRGKSIRVELKDRLKENATYTIDFSDAISDNNEGNSMGNYTYVFSTGAEIDTLEVGGTVIDAHTFEPVKGILVGLYRDLSDTAFLHKPLERVARTDGNGRFAVRGVAPGKYRVYALQDMDGNYRYSQKSEMMAASDIVVEPSAFADVRQDTVWKDSLHIARIIPRGYTHFVPDDVVLQAFTAVQTDRYLIKTERTEPDRFTFYFSYGADSVPAVRLLNVSTHDPLMVLTNATCDTVSYWLRDTALVHADSLWVEARYAVTDSAGQMLNRTDTLLMLSKIPYARRLRMAEKAKEDWEKENAKKRKQGEPVDSVMPLPPLAVEIKTNPRIDPNGMVRLKVGKPLEKIDSTKIHLYTKIDSLWYKAQYALVPLTQRNAERLRAQNTDSLEEGVRPVLDYVLVAAWKPGREYSMELDSAAFTDIYGNVSAARKVGLKVGAADEYAGIKMTVTGYKGKNIVVELLNSSDNVEKQVSTLLGEAVFDYVSPGTYYMRMYEDINGNRQWDTGDFHRQIKPEPTYYYPKKIECRAKWDYSETWNPTATPLLKQKPGAIIKQKEDKKRNIKSRNVDRARQLGVIYPQK